MNELQNTMQIVATTSFDGHALNIYGNEQEPLFKARDVAEMIDYSKTSQGYYDTQSMLRAVDDDEKLKAPTENLRSTPNPNTYRGEVWLLTEQGLYEVLFQSRKPKAKAFKKWVKQILKEIRTNGYYMEGELIEAPTVTTLEDTNLAYLKARLSKVLKATSVIDVVKQTTDVLRIACAIADADK